MLLRPYIPFISILIISILIFNSITQFFSTYGVSYNNDLKLLNLILLLSVILSVYYVFLKLFLNIELSKL